MEGLGWDDPLAPGQLHPHGDENSSVPDRGNPAGPCRRAGRGWGALPPAHLLRGGGRWLGGGIRVLGSHFPGGSTISSSRNASSPVMRSSRCSACQATLWKSCGEMPWFSHQIPAFIHLELSSQPAAISRKQTHPGQHQQVPYILQTHPGFCFIIPGKGGHQLSPSSALQCSLQGRGVLVSPSRPIPPMGAAPGSPHPSAVWPWPCQPRGRLSLWEGPAG